jgi:hypothetical protein
MVSEIKERIRRKIDTINDPEYLASLDAILTYEAVNEEKINSMQLLEKCRMGWQRLMKRFRNE